MASASTTPPDPSQQDPFEGDWTLTTAHPSTLLPAGGVLRIRKRSNPIGNYERYVIDTDNFGTSTPALAAAQAWQQSDPVRIEVGTSGNSVLLGTLIHRERPNHAFLIDVVAGELRVAINWPLGGGVGGGPPEVGTGKT